MGLGGANYRLFARNLEADPRRTPEGEVSSWERRVEPLVRAMVQADGTLFIAGPSSDAEDPVAAWEGRAGGLLSAVSAETGEQLAEYPLDAPPVFDSLIATPGRLPFSATNGRVVCFGHGNANP